MADYPLSGEELINRLQVALQTPGKMQYSVKENLQGQLYFEKSPRLIVPMGSMGNDARVYLNGPGGERYTIEASAAAMLALLGTIDADTSNIASDTSGILSDTGDILTDTGTLIGGRWERRAARPSWNSVPGTETESWRAEPLNLAFSATTDIAGNYSGNIIPPLAGYFGCVNIEYVWASGTDPAWDLSFAAAGGFTGPAAMVGLASVANAIGPNWSPGLEYRTTADNTGLTLNIANGGNAITYWFYGTLHYET